MKKQFPLWYHPTSVLFIDDNQPFLRLLSQHIDPSFPCVLESNPHNVIDQLKNRVYHLTDMAKHFANENFEFSQCSTSHDVLTYDVRMDYLNNTLVTKDRLEKFAVIVVDRHMPGVDGISLCEEIRSRFPSSVKLILFTGETSMEEAVDAFNSGKIDAFIQKKIANPHQMVEKLNQLIKKLAWEQFQLMSQELFGFLYHHLSFLSDIQCYDHFFSILLEHDIVEFCLRDHSGSFLLIDSQGNKKMLLIRKEEDFDTMFELAQDSGAGQRILLGLRDRKYFPFTQRKNGELLLTPDEWERVMVSTRPISTTGLFYNLVDMGGLAAV